MERALLAGLNPGAYSGGISTDLSTPLPALPPNPALEDVRKKLAEVQQRMQADGDESLAGSEGCYRSSLRCARSWPGLRREQQENAERRFQGDWAARVLNNGKVTGVFTDYHYFGTGDIGGAPNEESVKRLEAIVTKGMVDLPPQDGASTSRGQDHAAIAGGAGGRGAGACDLGDC